jgi:hypothetical protein
MKHELVQNYVKNVSTAMCIPTAACQRPDKSVAQTDNSSWSFKWARNISEHSQTVYTPDINTANILKNLDETDSKFYNPNVHCVCLLNITATEQ